MTAPVLTRRDRVALAMARVLGDWRWDDIALVLGFAAYLVWWWLS